jgi:hypothetical protein
MREEHPNQQELPDLPPGGPAPAPAPGSDQVREMSEVAALQAQVLDLGLVREGRPVFVYDAKLAKQKSANAARQERHRKKIADSGLVVMPIPNAIASAVKEAGGDWSKITEALGKGSQGREMQGIGGDEVIPQAVRAEITEAGGLDQWVQKRVDSAIAALPPVPPASPVAPKIVEKIVEKVVEKRVLKLNSQQEKLFELGKKVAQLSGWRASVLRWLL